jgi:D-alanyl-D-alanine dipeptidase
MNRKEFSVAELKKIEAGSSAEPLVDVRTYDNSILVLPRNKSADRYTESIIMVRDTVAKKLAAVNRDIGDLRGLRLKIMSGYRRPDVQAEGFTRKKELLRRESPELSEDELNEAAHLFIAYPPVAGHPTGGAVDVSLSRDDGELDMGDSGGIPAPGEPVTIRTFSDGLAGEQLSNRIKLNTVMFLHGFIPFWGEWWHFSYGDREWAAFSGLSRAIYGEVFLEPGR